MTPLLLIKSYEVLFQYTRYSDVIERTPYPVIVDRRPDILAAIHCPKSYTMSHEHAIGNRALCILSICRFRILTIATVFITGVLLTLTRPVTITS